MADRWTDEKLAWIRASYMHYCVFLDELLAERQRADELRQHIEWLQPKRHGSVPASVEREPSESAAAHTPGFRPGTGPYEVQVPDDEIGENSRGNDCD